MSFVGQFLVLAGSALLFFYGLPHKKIGSVVVWGIQAMNVAGPGEESTPQEKWQPLADAFIRRVLVLNRTGFGLIAIGSVLQMVSIFF